VGVIGAGRGVGWVVGSQVGKQGLRWDRVLAAGGRVDLEMVGWVIEEEIHA
jgi:alkylated DNA nucleotide flippase Atl1